jgi:hypothetical protein
VAIRNSRGLETKVKSDQSIDPERQISSENTNFLPFSVQIFKTDLQHETHILSRDELSNGRL